MTTVPGSVEGPSSHRNAGGAFLVCGYLFVLLIVPARLVFSRIPMTLAPVIVLAFGLGLLWFCAQFVSTLGAAKGRVVVRSALFAYLAAHLVTYAVATRRYLPPDELNLADSAMIRITATVAVAVFVCDALRTRTALDQALRFLVGAASVVAAVGLLQFAVGVDLVQYVNLPGLQALTGYDAILERSAFRRPAGTTNHPIEFGLVCAAAVPLAAHYLLQSGDRGEPSGRWWLSFALVGGGAVTSLSRTAILGLAVAVIIMAFAVPGRRKIYVLLTGLGFVGVAGLFVPGLLGTLFQLFATIGEDESVTSRTEDYTEAWDQVDLHPVLGRGFGTYLPDKYQVLDNQYLLTLIETGWAGLVVLIGLLLAGSYAAARAAGRTSDPTTRTLGASLVAGLAVCAVGAATFDLLSFGVATGVLFLLVGACGALWRIVGDDAASPHGGARDAMPPRTAPARRPGSG